MIADEDIQILISKRKISATVKRLAGEIAVDYRDKFPLLVGILKGSFIFMSDLVRCLDIPLEVEFVRLTSYSGTQSTGKTTLVHELPCLIQGRHVLIVEDIIDTGLTACFLSDYLRKQSPASIKLCALIDKPCRRRSPIRIDYSGFTVPDEFIVGYGLDYNEKYRNLSDICIIKGKG
ncbi:MAG: hypoxanthine phosphoribosyltransferase [Dehalococcoidales bacterium]|nr:hypoxanthine phosphoribosyltransferase [Dehalococcoidales bacterium]